MELLAVLAANEGVINRARLPQLRGAINRALKSGEIERILPSVYSRTGEGGKLMIKVRAVMEADPDAVIVGRAAAVLHGLLGEDDCSTIEVASQRLHSQGWLRKSRRRIPVELIVVDRGIRVSSAALTVVDLIPVMGSGIVDNALRRRIRLDDMTAAVAACPGRRGNQTRAAVLARSASQPWSAAERAAHEALLAAGIHGWSANVSITSSIVADIVFDELKLIVEIDGYAYHGDKQAFVKDRRRDGDLASRGWQVVHFAAEDVLNEPARFAAMAKRICKVRARQLGVRTV